MIDLCIGFIVIRVDRLQFEAELQAVHAAHEALVRSSERKDALERAARLRLEVTDREIKVVLHPFFKFELKVDQ